MLRNSLLLLVLGSAFATGAPGQLTFVTWLPGTFIDISATGQPVGTLPANGSFVSGFGFTSGNALFSNSYVMSENGALRFQPPTSGDPPLSFVAGPVNEPIPSLNCFMGFQSLLPFWDDLDGVGAHTGGMYVEDVNGTLIFQWNDLGFSSAGVNFDRVTFQVQIPPSGVVLARFVYEDVEQMRAAGGGSATIGYQSGGFMNDVPFSFNAPGSVQNDTVLSLVGGGFGANYCSANVNSTGGAASITPFGSNVVADNNFVLICHGMPVLAFGLFLTARQQALIMNPGGSAGNLCITGSVGRFQQQIQNSGQGGLIMITADLTALAQPNGTVQVLAGETWNFTTWFRDTDGMGGASSNFSDGVEVTFL